MATSREASAQALVTLRNLAVATFVLVGLFVGRDLLIPLCYAVLVAFLLEPAMRRLRRWTGRAIAVLAVVGAAVVALGSVGWVMSAQLAALNQQAPKYEQAVRDKFAEFRLPRVGVVSEVRRLYGALTNAGNAPAAGGADANVMAVRVVEQVRPVDALARYGGSSLSFLANVGIVLLLVIFVLLEYDSLQLRLLQLVGAEHLASATLTFNDAARRIRRYLNALLVVNLMFGVVVASALAWLQIPQPVLWGCLAALLRFIPYVGVWVAAAIPAVLSLAIGTTLQTPLLVLALFLGLELLTANVVEPWLYGSATGVSPFALMLAAIFWTSMWGVAGLAVSTPLTVLLMAIGRQVRSLSFLETLLGERQEPGAHERLYYQVLRGLPSRELWREFERVAAQRGLVGLQDEYFLPAWNQLHADAERARFDDQHFQAALQTLERLAADAEDMEPAAGPTDGRQLPCVACVPVRFGDDAFPNRLAAQLLRHRHMEVFEVHERAQLRELMQRLAGGGVDVLLVSVPHSAALNGARRLIAHAHSLRAQQRVVVGIWRLEEADRDATRVLAGEHVVLAYSMAEALAACLAPATP